MTSMDPDAREDWSRISVSSVPDWQQIKAKLHGEAISSIKEYVFKNGLSNEGDALLAHANQFIEHAFRIAQPNLRVNGQNFESLNQDEQQNMEPFDEALDRRIWSLAATRLQWQKRIADTRRKLPQETEAMMKELLREQQEVETCAAAALILEEEVVDPDPEQLLRHSEINKEFLAALASGEELNQIIPAQTERAQRIQDVMAELAVLKP